MARKPRESKPRQADDEPEAKDEVKAKGKAEPEEPAGPPPWATHESDSVEQMCVVTITDAVKPLGRSRVEAKDPRGNTHVFVRTGHKKILTSRMMLAPSTQRDMRARGWLVAAEVKE